MSELVPLLGKDNPVILEIGCNNGGHTAQFLELFPRASIYCFEPDPRACAAFRERLGADPRVRLYEMAISNQDGEIDFFMSDTHPEAGLPYSWYDSGSIRPPKKHLEFFPWITFEKTIKVQRSGSILGARNTRLTWLILSGQMCRVRKWI
ncbi:MAG: FkbM family methyltransferase [Gloeomargarita sp. SKYB31]|nr:FkbM family methyltransferase [Gloeomargarita sp. SKYB31]